MTQLLDAPIAETTNRDATKEDAQTLRRLYFILKGNKADWSSATRRLKVGKVDAVTFGEQAESYARCLETSAAALRDIPKGTAMPGGATRQSVYTAFLHGVGADLDAPMSAAQAKNLNNASFEM